MKTVLITGGSQGIGLEAVKRFVGLGYQVVTCSRTPDTWRQMVEQHPPLKHVDYRCCDLSDDAQLQQLFTHIKTRYASLDIAVNNASPALKSVGPFADIEKAALRHTLTHDLWSHVLCLQQELQLMDQGAAIVNVSSVNGLRPTPNAAMYSAAKHGLEGLTRSVAIEAIARGIRVNAVAPGVTWTPRWDKRRDEHNPNLKEEVEQLVPAGRFAEAAEIVNAIEWLSSDRASYIVGHTLVVDGGVSLK